MTLQRSKKCDFSLIYRILAVNTVCASGSVSYQGKSGWTAVVQCKLRLISADVCNIIVTAKAEPVPKESMYNKD